MPTEQLQTILAGLVTTNYVRQSIVVDRLMFMRVRGDRSIVHRMVVRRGSQVDGLLRAESAPLVRGYLVVVPSVRSFVRSSLRVACVDVMIVSVVLYATALPNCRVAIRSSLSAALLHHL